MAPILCAREHVITNRHDLAQMNRVLPSALRLTDTTFLSLTLALNEAQREIIITDTSLVMINRAVEAIDVR